MLESLLSSDISLTAIVSAVSIIAVGVPFYRGLRIFFEARAATRVLDSSELRQVVQGSGAGRVGSIAGLMLRVLRKSLQDSSAGEMPREFVIDASRQYAVNEYDSHYAQRISMYSNILPPLGFIGTTSGLLILFFSMHAASASLELGALALALVSSILALMGFAVLEGLKIGLYGRLLNCLDQALETAQRSRPATAGAPAGSASATAR